MMDSGGVSNSQHYANLLSTVGELRSELERSVSKMQTLEEQNRLMQGNNKSLKEELLETRKKYQIAQNSYMKTVACKFEDGRQHAMEMESIKAEVAEKEKHFAALREEFTHPDIDSIRIKVQEELETPHRQRILAMEAEVEKHKEESFKNLRELERCKADYEAYSALQQRNAAAATEDYEASLNEMQCYVADLKNRNFDKEKEDKLRTQRIRLGELEQTCKSLLTEIAAVRTERDETVYSSEQFRVHADEEMSSMRARVAIYETDKLAAEKRAMLLSSDLDVKESNLRTAKQELEYANDQMDNLKAQLVDAHSNVDRVREDGLVNLEQQRIRFETERGEQASQIDSLHAKLLNREEQIRRLQREVVEAQVRTEAVEANVRSVYGTQLADARSRADTALLSFTDIRDKMSSELASLRQMVDSKAHENENYKSEMTRIRREKGLLYDKLQGLEQRVVSEKSKYAVLKRDLTTKLSVLEEREARLKEDLAAMTSAYEEARVHDEEQQKEIRRLQSKIAGGEVEIEKRVNQATKGLREQQENVERICLMKLETAKRDARDAVAKERRKADAYKEKALASHARNKALVSKYAPDVDVTAHLR